MLNTIQLTFWFNKVSLGLYTQQPNVMSLKDNGGGGGEERGEENIEGKTYVRVQLA